MRRDGLIGAEIIRWQGQGVETQERAKPFDVLMILRLCTKKKPYLLNTIPGTVSATQASSPQHTRGGYRSCSGVRLAPCPPPRLLCGCHRAARCADGPHSLVALSVVRSRCCVIQGLGEPWCQARDHGGWGRSGVQRAGRIALPGGRGRRQA